MSWSSVPVILRETVVFPVAEVPPLRREGAKATVANIHASQTVEASFNE
jgi:hypothetical protein